MSVCLSVCIKHEECVEQYKDVDENVLQTERQKVSHFGSYECQLGPLPGCQHSVLMEGGGFPQLDVTVPCQNSGLLGLFAEFDDTSLYHSGLCQSLLELPPPKQGQVMRLAVL